MNEQELAKLLAQLNRNLDQNSRLMQGMVQAQGLRIDGGMRSNELAPTHPRQTKAGAQTFEKYDTAVARLNKETGNFTKNIKAINEQIKSLKDAWDKNDLEENIGMYSQGLGTLGAQAERLAQGMSRFSSNIAKSTKAQSLLYAEQLRNTHAFKNYEFASYLEKLTDSLDDLDVGAKRALGVIDMSTKKLRTDISIEEFQGIRRKLGEFEASIANQLSGMRGVDGGEVASLADLVKMGKGAFTGEGNLNDATGKQLQKNRDAIVRIAAEAAARGLYQSNQDRLSVFDKNGNLKGAAEMAKVDFATLAQRLQKLSKGVASATATMDNVVDKYTVPWQRSLESVFSKEGRRMLWGGLKDWMLGGAAFATFVRGLKHSFEEMVNFNIAQVPQNFIKTQQDALMMGMSFQDTVKLLQENKRMLAIYGPGEFRTAMGGMQNTFRKFGYTMQQSAELIGPTIEGAIVGGVNVRSPEQLAKYSNVMMNSFQKIAGVIDISAKEFFQLNAQLFKSEGTFENLVGMDKNRRFAYQQELVQLRERYVLGGLDIQTSQKLIELQQQQARDSVKNRINAGAKLMQSAMFSGMDMNSAMRLMTLRNKGERTGAEQEEFTRLMGQLGSARERQRKSEASRYGGNTWMTDAFNDANQLESSDMQIMNSANQMNMAKDAGAVTANAEAARAAQAAKGSVVFAALNDVVNMVSAVLKNSLITTVLGASASLVALAWQAGNAAAALGRMGGANISGAPGPSNKKGGLMGRMAGASKWMKGFGIAGSVALGGLALSSASSADLPQSDKNALYGQAIGGMIGGGLGSFLGPLGTIAGGYIGSLGGEWAGRYFSEPGQQKPSAIVAQEGINTPASDGSGSLFEVADNVSREHLANLHATMLRVADTLDKMMQMGNEDSTKPRPLVRVNPIADQNSYLTGQR